MKLLAKLLLAGAVLTAVYPTVAEAKLTHVMPKLKEVKSTDGSVFRLGRPVSIVDPTGCELLRDFFKKNGCTESAGGVPVKVTLTNNIPGAYDYKLYGYPDEAYSIKVTPDRIDIQAVTPTGVIRAAQTLGQMAEGWPDGQAALETADITDWPAFKLRGYMHDVGRSYIDVDELIKEIELLSRFKINTFHWHMTENQAWRFEVKAFPQLTSAESMTRLPGKYYTQDDCRRVLEAARKHGVTVIPEIDMPGHSEAFERAMGFEMQSEQGKQTLTKVLDEVAEVFPDVPYIHIGGDEKRITDNTFLPGMAAKIHSLGKKAICWNPIMGVKITPELGFDMTQMWGTAGRLVKGLPNIDCRYNYSNHFDTFADIAGIYKSSVYYAPRGNEEIAGAITAPWNDRQTPEQSDIIRQNNFYASALATAERAWMGGGEQYIEKGGTALPASGPEHDEFADWERRFLFHKEHSLKNEPIPYVRHSDVRWRITDPFPNGGDVTKAFPPERKLARRYNYDGRKYGTHDVAGAGVYLRHTWGDIVPALFPADSAKNHTAYAYTYIYSPEEREAGALIEFQNYSRSEKDLVPDGGKWDFKGSRIWLNDREIPAPQWANSGRKITNETMLVDENQSARKPVPVKLRKGWNKVLVKLPYITLDRGTVRLNKWYFQFVLTDPEGREALDGIIYSPDRKS